MRFRSLVVAGAIFSASIFSVGVMAAPAQADTIPDSLCGGVIDVDYCLWYNSYQKGGRVATYRDIDNWSGWIFSDSGEGTNGVGQPVKNNAASYANSSYSKTGVSYFNSNYAGAYDVAPPRDRGNLVNTYNENASFRWR